MITKARLCELLDGDAKDGGNDRWVHHALIGLIVVTTLGIILESIPSVKANPQFHRWLNAVEYWSLWVFLAEFCVRVWCAPCRRSYFRHPMAWIDMLALLPLVGPWVGLDIRRYRLLRSVRVFRILKLTRFLPGMDLVARVIKSRGKELGASLALLVLVLVCTSTVMYFVEHDAQPDKFASIPETMWWGIVTITTTGYGDVYPMTGLGHLMGGVFAVLGVFTFALPTAILGSGFLEEVQRQRAGHSPTAS